jgi:hypothetical protein
MFARVSSFLGSSPVPNWNSAASVSDVGAGEIVVIPACEVEPRYWVRLPECPDWERVLSVGTDELGRVVIQGSYGTCALDPDAPVEIEAVTGLQIPDSLLP